MNSESGTTTEIYLPDIFTDVTSLYGKSISIQRFLISKYISQYETEHKLLYISPSKPQQFLSFLSEMDEESMNKTNIKTTKTMQEQQQVVDYLRVGYENISGIIFDPFTTQYRLNRAAITNGFRPDGIDTDSTESQAITQLERQLFKQIQQLYIISHRRDIPIIITNESYYNPDKEQICPLGGALLNRWYDNEFETRIVHNTQRVVIDDQRTESTEPPTISVPKKYHSLIGDIK